MNTHIPGTLSAADAARRGDAASRPHAGFTLMEIMVVVLLLSAIILGLLEMFDQTQRAFRGSMTQVDVLEAGRSASDLIARELAQLTPARSSNAVNFFVQIPPGVQPSYQGLPGLAPERRTNVLEQLFFVSQQNQAWSSSGYFVLPTTNLLGTLYRVNATANWQQNPATLYTNFFYQMTYLTNASPLMDGVVHFRVRAFDTNSSWITPLTQGVGTTNASIIASWSSSPPGEIGWYQFTSNAVPAYVEVEIGILEDRTLQRYRSLPTAAVQQAYLSNHVAQVHLFRQRIPIRNVDATAY